MPQLTGAQRGTSGIKNPDEPGSFTKRRIKILKNLSSLQQLGLVLALLASKLLP